MQKLLIPLLAIVLLSACLTPSPRHYGNIGGSYEYVSSPAVYDPYARKNNYLRGFASEDQLEEALKLKKKYGKDIDVIINYSHTQFEFNFAKDSVVVGKPIQVQEMNEEMVTSLSDGVKYFKSEHFNSNVQFEGFYENYAGELDTSYIKSSYVEKQVGSNGIFYSDAKKAQATWDLPVPGSSVRIRHNKFYEDVKYFTTIFFHDEHPKQETVITFKIPIWLNIEIVERNFDGFGIRRTDSSFTIGRKILPAGSNLTGSSKKNSSGKVSKAKQKPSDNTFKYITYIFNNTSALKEEDLYPGATHNLPHLIVLCKSYDSVELAKSYIVTDKKKGSKTAQVKSVPKNSKGKKDNVQVIRELPKNIKGTIANTYDLYNWCHEIASLTDNKIDSIKPIAMEIIKGKNTDKEKVEAIFYWVQDNIRYVAFEDGLAAFKPDACQNVLSKKYGDCKGMGNLIKCLLVSLGYDARLTWIGTKRLNIDYSIPSISTSNHMICSIVLDGKRYFLDGTQKYIGIGDYAHRIQGRPAMIEDGKNYIIDTVPDLPYMHNQHDRSANFSISDDGIISGKVLETIKGENKTNFLNQYHYAEKSDRPYVVKKHLKDFDPNYTITDIKHTDFDNRVTDIELQYNLSILYNSVKDGNIMMIKPDYVSELRNHDNDTSRLSKLAYGYKLYYTHHYTYQLPKGYSVKQLPEPVKIENDECIMELTFRQSGDKVVYEKKLILLTGYIAKNNIKRWNADITKLEKGYNSYIILSKK
jgi:hypothetical protein